MAQRPGKLRIKEPQFRQFLFDALNRGDIEAQTAYKFYDRLRQDYAICKQRVVDMHRKYFKEWSDLQAEAHNTQTQEFATEGIAEGVKSKTERLLFYQKEIRLMEQQLSGEVEFTFVVKDKIVNSHKEGEFKAPIQIQNEIRRTIKEYQTEISRIQGDYAPKKVDVNDVTKAKITFPGGTVVEY